MTSYRLTVPQLIVELRKWARARDRVNQKPGREGRPLSSDPLLEAANRLEDYYNQDDPERLANYQARRQYPHCEPDHDHSEECDVYVDTPR